MSLTRLPLLRGGVVFETIGIPSTSDGDHTNTMDYDNSRFVNTGDGDHTNTMDYDNNLLTRFWTGIKIIDGQQINGK